MGNTLRGQLEIKVGKKKFKSLINLNALRLFCQQENITLAEFEEHSTKHSMDMICKLAYIGIKNNCLLNGETTPEIDYEVFAAHVLSDNEEFTKLSEAFGKALGTGNE